MADLPHSARTQARREALTRGVLAGEIPLDEDTYRGLRAPFAHAPKGAAQAPAVTSASKSAKRRPPARG